jgi:hypothetical protein
MTRHHNDHAFSGKDSQRFLLLNQIVSGAPGLNVITNGPSLIRQ